MRVPDRVAHTFRELISIDVRTLAVLRMGMASLILVDLLDRGRHIAEFYTDDGFMPREIVPRIDELALSYHMLGGSFEFQLALFATAAVFAAMLLVGYRTRAASVMSWLLLVSLHNRNYFVSFGGDLELQRVLFWCLFLPLGARWSLDARRAPGELEPNVRVTSVASAAVLIQVAYVYLFSGLSKTGPAWVGDYDAIYLALQNEFLVVGIGPWLRQYESLLFVITPLVVYFERFSIFLFFCPFRTPQVRCGMILAIWGFHLGTAAIINLSTFPLMCAVCALAYLPTWFWERVGGDESTGAEPRVIATPRPAVQVGLGLALVYTTAFLIADVNPRATLPAVFRELGHLLQLDQSWSLYAPEPSPYDIHRTVRGRLENGEVVEDLIAAGRGETWRSVQAIHESKRFRVYIEMWSGPRFRPDVAVYGQWLCRQWNTQASTPEVPEHALRSVAWIFDARRILPAGQREPVIREVLFDHECE